MTDDESKVLEAVRQSKYGPDSCENIADDTGLSVNRTRRALLHLVELGLVRRWKGAYGRVRYLVVKL